jgi:hypothetical protein
MASGATPPQGSRGRVDTDYCLVRLQANVEPEWGPTKHPVCLHLRIALLQSDFALPGAMPWTDF